MDGYNGTTGIHPNLFDLLANMAKTASVEDPAGPLIVTDGVSPIDGDTLPDTNDDVIGAY